MQTTRFQSKWRNIIFLGKGRPGERPVRTCAVSLTILVGLLSVATFLGFDLRQTPWLGGILLVLVLLVLMLITEVANEQKTIHSERFENEAQEFAKILILRRGEVVELGQSYHEKLLIACFNDFLIELPTSEERNSRSEDVKNRVG